MLILDVDPPWLGITAFLQTLGTELPSARALVIGTEIPSEIAAERGSFGALQFVGKPFELAEFGAAIQALLGPWAHSTQPRGSLGALGTIDLVLLQCAAGGNVVLDVRSDAGRSGKIYIAGAQVTHAEAGNAIGADALRQILSWSQGQFTESKPAALPARTLPDEWVGIVVEALKKTKPAVAPRLSPPEELARPRPLKGKKIVVVDDTEMLLIFVEDVLSTAHPELKIATAVTGIDGVREVGKIIPDLVLLDYSLPDINGDEVCRRLLENEDTAGVPILMMSGHVAQMQATAEEFENVVATIEKPFLSDALVQLVEKTLAAGPKQRRHGAAGRRQRSPKPSSTPPPPPAPAEPIVAPTPARVPPPPLSQPKAPSRPSPAPEPAKAAPPKIQPERREQFTVRPEPVISLPETIQLASSATVTQTAPRIQRPAVKPTPSIPPAATIKSAPPVSASPARAVGVAGEGNRAVLGLFLEVLSMQLTPQLQMGAIRAKPSSPIVSLHLSSAAARGAIPPETAFQLGPAELDASGRILTLRVVATTQPLQRTATRASFEIGGVALIPNHTRARVQLTPAGTTPMTIELLAQLELGSVQLSATFKVAQLILKWPTNIVRVTLDPKSVDKTGAAFQPSEIKLDPAGRIAELLLKPAVSINPNRAP
jgi:CheY-like chemotaxis protein